MTASGNERNLVVRGFRVGGEKGDCCGKDPPHASRTVFHRFSSPSSKTPHCCRQRASRSSFDYRMRSSYVKRWKRAARLTLAMSIKRDRALADLALAVVWRWPGGPIGRDPPRPSTVRFVIARENTSPGGSGKAGRGAIDANPAFGQIGAVAQRQAYRRAPAKGLDPSAAPPQGRRLHRRVPDLRQAWNRDATTSASRQVSTHSSRPRAQPRSGKWRTTSSAPRRCGDSSKSPALRGIDVTRRRPNRNGAFWSAASALSRRDSFDSDVPSIPPASRRPPRPKSSPARPRAGSAATPCGCRETTSPRRSAL